jgi:FtsH-binding integral membrane protein
VSDSRQALGEDRLRRVLILGMLLGLGSRVTVFAGGGAGGLVSSGLFWLSALAVIVFSARQRIRRSQRGSTVPILKWGLLLGAVLSFLSLAVTEGSVGKVFVGVLLVCVLALIVLAIKDAVSGFTGGPRSPGSTEAA